MRQSNDDKPSWFVTSLDESARNITCQAKVKMVGLRLHPGVTINESKLLSAVQEKHSEELDLSVIISECVSLSLDTQEALYFLSDNFATVNSVAKTIGVSTRTLQRKVLSETNKSPMFWISLARARKAASALTTNTPLVEIAIDHGFSDQAHLTREIQRWFCQTPTQLRNDPKNLSSILALGFSSIK